jgi:hypothetical protein
MSSESQEEELEQSLMPQDELSKLQPCANFLLGSVLGKWYKGEIHKNDDTRMRAILEKIGARNKYSTFISYKFVRDGRRFCITFRKETTVADILNNLGGVNNVFLIRLSLIEEDTSKTSKRKSGVDGVSDETSIKCMGKESLIIKPNFFVDGIEIPTEQKAQFSSITSGDTPDQIALVQGMHEMTEYEPNQYKDFFKTHIEEHMKILVKILVEHCDGKNTVSQGGATRRHKRLTHRRKSLIGRKGKKSYRKKKYGKTKKSRRFRRSVRSRR